MAWIEVTQICNSGDPKNESMRITPFNTDYIVHVSEDRDDDDRCNILDHKGYNYVVNHSRNAMWNMIKTAEKESRTRHVEILK